MLRLRLIPALCLSILLVHAPSDAQDLQDFSSCKIYAVNSSQAERLEDISRFYGSADAAVRFDCDEMQFFADFVEIFKKQDLLNARGHVVFVSGGNRIAADRAEFNLKTKTGTFFNAYGSAELGNPTELSMFGTQEPDVLFRGTEIRKIGPKKYRIIDGGFTTCVQPTPRWELSSGGVTLNLDDYALLTNSVFRVKGVPLLYLPVFYYPIQEDDRATGFLIPTYGTSTAKGHVLSNAFFWAINRSHDATIMHDWLSKAGQQIGGEYRYILSPGSQGNARFSFLDEKAIATTNGDGTIDTSDPRRTYTISGGAVQVLPRNFRLRANADYFSSVITMQQYQQDLHRATNSNRRFGVNVAGALGQYQISATADRNDYFYSATTLQTNGTLPRISVIRPERPIARSSVYFGVNSEYATLIRSSVENNEQTSDQGLSRVDVNPVLRVPFNRWPFFGINSAISWRGTYWTESLTPPVPGERQTQIEEGIGRQYVDVQARIIGPVFTKIFNPPEGSTRQKFKHVIEPTVTVKWVSAIDEFARIVRLDGLDSVVGGLTQYTYGLTNRLYGKKDVARELASVSINQSYYTKKGAATFDPQYQTSYSAANVTNYSPVVLLARMSPMERLQATFRTEWDPTVHALRTLAASGNYSEGNWLNVSAGWSQRRFIETLPGFNDPGRADQYINAIADVRGFRNRIGGTFTFNYDLLNDRFLQRRWMAYYNAQCCGIGVEYQNFNLHGSFVTNGVTEDRRFNISFTLAGIGTFSNLFGAFGGQQGR